MANPVVSLLPQQVDLALYAGDGPVLRMTVADSSGDAVPVDGVVSAQIRTARTDTDALASFAADLSEGDQGIVVLSLTAEQTAGLMTGVEKFSGVWDVEWDPADGEPVTLLQGKVSCVLDVTRPA